MGIRRLTAIALLAALLGGCAASRPPQPPQALPEPVLDMPEPEVNGAIYQAGQDVRLYEDRTARRVGDIVTVILEEQTDANKDANAQYAKDYSYSLPTPTIAGQQPTYNGAPISFDIENSQDFQGGGQASQSNELSGTLTATVVRVQRNGNLVVQGQKQLTLNRGDEYVTVTGVVRQDDIRPDNTVSSTRIANAQISYTGSGALADSSTMGWLSRVFVSAVWPF